MKRFLSASAATVIAVVALTGPTFAQGCPQDDNFGFPLGCCTPAAPNLPNFPTMTVGGLGACIRDCGVENQYNTQTTIAPTQLLCDYWIMGISIVAPTFVATTPTLVAKYSRTWVEFPVAGAAPLQVWRFLVNGDFTFPGSATAGAGCPIPLSAFPPFSLPVHYVGNVDYAFDCASGAWSIAYTLTHFCPTEMHAPFSARPIPVAGMWPKRTYHFVGPANFVFGLCAQPDGPLIAEDTRTSIGLTNPAVPYTCLRETQVVQGVLQNQFQNCACFDPSPIAPPARYVHQSLIASEVCAGAAAPIMNFGGFAIPFMPTGLRALMLGSYIPTPANPYPGNECITVYLGVLESPGLCVPPVAVPNLHAVTGIGTTGGFLSQLFNSTLPAFVPLEFLDLHNMLVLGPAGFTPGLGALFGSERVWNFNSL